MTLKSLAIAYVLGGFTLVPLLLLAIFVPAWYWLPKQEKAPAPANGERGLAEETEKLLGAAHERRRSEQILDEPAASGTFAVLRRYDFQAAVSALDKKNNASNGTGNGSSNGDASSVADGGPGSGSESVYQAMYRSVFDRNKTVNSTSSLLSPDEETDTTGTNKRKPAPPTVFYVVLRHGHLMLYDSPAQVEVKHVISLAHYGVSLQSGNGALDEDFELNMIESDLFVKRTAIVLMPVEAAKDASGRLPRRTPSRPFYLFCATNIEKEDFYHTLLATRANPPIPQELDQEALIKLQSSLHSQTLTPETRAIDALIGRIFLSLQHTDYLSRFLLTKIEKKLSRIQKPSFIPSLRITSLDLGDAAPVISNLRLKDFNISGDLTLSLDMRYTGGLSLTLLAVAKLDLGPRFKSRTVDLALKTSLQRINGTMLVRVKPPPSNRIWFTFDTVPEMDVRVEPVVSERKITYGFITRAIEDKVRSAIGEGLVRPNWDDIPMPLTDTRGHVRGGLWSDEGSVDELQRRASAPADVLGVRNEKTMSTPSLVNDEVDAGATATGISSTSELDLSKLRHTATMPAGIEQSLKRRSVGLQQVPDSPSDKESRPLSLPPKPLRSPSFTSPATTPPVLAVDNAERVRADDVNLKPSTQTRKAWLLRGAAALPQPAKDALEELRGVRDRAESTNTKPSAIVTGEVDDGDDGFGDADLLDDHSLTDAPDGDDSLSTHSRKLSDTSTFSPSSPRRTDSLASTASSVKSQPSLQQRKATVLAATAAATSAARSWGWNAVQRNKGTLPWTPKKPPDDETQPMGRGQPLPPPGVPLPGPQKSLWPAIGAIKRKSVPPLLPPRRPRADGTPQDKVDGPPPPPPSEPSQTEQDIEDEFGPWSENSGPSAVENGEDVHQLVGAAGAENAPDETTHQHDVPSDGTPSPFDTNPEGAPETITAPEATALETQPSLPSSTQPDPTVVHAHPRKAPPPPLPARRRQPSQPSSSRDARASATITTASRPASSIAEEPASASPTHDHGYSASALRVPSPVDAAVAAENATDALAHGTTDDRDHVDAAAAVEVDVGGGGGGESTIPAHDTGNTASGDDLGDTDPEEEKQAEAKFVQGAHVGEEDFTGGKEERRSSLSGGGGERGGEKAGIDKADGF